MLTSLLVFLFAQRASSVLLLAALTVGVATSDATITAFFVSLPATIAAIATLIVAVRSSKQVQKIEVATNSMREQLVKAALIQGIEQGTNTEKARVYDAAEAKAKQ